VRSKSPGLRTVTSASSRATQITGTPQTVETPTQIGTWTVAMTGLKEQAPVLASGRHWVGRLGFSLGWE
jgi:hypothetical protein